MVSCHTIMCKYNLNNRSDTRKFILKNHPDKGGTIPDNDFKKILECYQDEKYCYKGENKTSFTLRKVTKKKRTKIFNCMRKTANFSKINMNHKFDKAIFNPTQLNKDIVDASPKIVQLLNNIKKLDELDQKNHGKKFKHFIFSDVKEGGYGAKILSSVFAANGFNNVIKARKVPNQQRLKLYIHAPSSEKNFGLLCSNSIYGTTFNEKIKKELLKLFNERPSNIHGQKLRFIIFDSGFKEGIDLFDVKYVHIFEPSMTIADLKQTVGRATRTCGQKGLDFLPGIGWPLYVYNYYLTVPTVTQDSIRSGNFITNNISKPKKGEIDSDVLIFKNVEKFNDATMLYSEFDKAMNNLSKQLFELAPTLAVDYELTKNLHKVDDLNYEFMEKDFYLKGGAKNIFKKVNKKSKYYNIELINCKGKCGKKNTKDIPVSTDFLKQVYYKYSHPRKDIPKTNQRQYFCDYMSIHPNADIYCAQLNKEWAARYAYVPEIVEKKKKVNNIKKELDEIDLETEEQTPEEIAIQDAEYNILEYSGKNTSSSSIIPKNKLSFVRMRVFIKSNYNTKEYKWEPIVVENKCIPKPGEKPKSASDVELNPTQKFITSYFRPESPYKGLLLWHSVGTGKTCSGVSIASTTFEKAGYSILWVTRTTLKSDVWKNVFDQICHSIILHEVKNGLVLPEKINQRKKLLSQSWLEPMSYKQFSNLLAGKNKIYDMLKERNGTTDLLKKTLIIIDEAHKLYGGDLKHTERPDTDVMEKLIMNSYKKSGDDSCKLLIMTATPFTNSPLELFKLINLFMTNESEKITTIKDEFKKEYMTSENILSQNGAKNLANKLSGYISYLNREKDPTQFAQPIMINVPVLMSFVDDNLRDALFLKKELSKLDESVQQEIVILKQKISTMKTELKKSKSEFTSFKKHAKNECSNLSGKEKKECNQKFKKEIDEMNTNLQDLISKINKLEDELHKVNQSKDNNKADLTNLKLRLKEIKKSLIQEYMLYKRCSHLRYVSIAKPKSHKKAKTLSIKRSKNNYSTRKNKSI